MAGGPIVSRHATIETSRVYPACGAELVEQPLVIFKQAGRSERPPNPELALVSPPGTPHEPLRPLDKLLLAVIHDAHGTAVRGGASVEGSAGLGFRAGKTTLFTTRRL